MYRSTEVNCKKLPRGPLWATLVMTEYTLWLRRLGMRTVLYATPSNIKNTRWLRDPLETTTTYFSTRTYSQA